jgi:Cu/Ag efflux protein CusF
MRLFKFVVAGVLLFGIAGAGSVTANKGTSKAMAEKAAPVTPQFAKVYGAVKSIDAQNLVVTLKDPAKDGSATQSILVTEWTRVVRENEDLTLTDVKPGDSVEVVCEVKDGKNEAVMICLPKI